MRAALVPFDPGDVVPDAFGLLGVADEEDRVADGEVAGEEGEEDGEADDEGTAEKSDGESEAAGIGDELLCAPG